MLERNRLIHLATTQQTSINMQPLRITVPRELRRWGAKSQIHSVCTTCMVVFGNGRLITTLQKAKASEPARSLQRKSRLIRQSRKIAARFAVVAGRILQNAFAQQLDLGRLMKNGKTTIRTFR